MRRSRSPGRSAILRFLAVTSLVCTALIAWSNVPPADAASDFADSAFSAQWTMGEAITPNFWGPLSLAHDKQMEPYVEATGGIRLVQYFDKARMEKKNDGTVSNGLLATELITGRLQLGDNTFMQGSPAGIPVAGDPDNLGPTYSEINTNKANLLDPSATAVNSPATKALSAAGQFGSFTDAMSDANTVITTFDTTTSHNVPKAFTDYRNKAGLLTIGLAISEPFWSNVKVGTVPKNVLIQAFERRILTYTATNPDAFKVEFGNIGAHYYTWRYLSPGALNTPTPVIPPATGTAIAQATGTATAATATALVATATPTVDMSPPKFKGAPTVAYTTPNSFAVNWETDEPASSELLFGESLPYGQQNSNLQKVFSVDHQVVIRNLTSGHTYHYAIQSRDVNGNVVKDDQDRTITLPADKNDGSSGAVPMITNLSIAKKTSTTFTITWNTNVPSRSRIEYGRADLPMSGSGEGYDRWRTGDNGDPSTMNHTITAISLQANTTYRFRIISILGDSGSTSSASDDHAVMSTLNSALTNGETTAIKINNPTAVQEHKGSPLLVSFNTDRNASVIIEIGTTNQFGGGFYYSSSDDPQGLRDYPYNNGFNRSLHNINLNLRAGTYFYRITVYDEQGTGTYTVDKAITIT